MKSYLKRLGTAAALVLALPLLLAAVSQFTAVIVLPNVATMRGLGAASAFYPNVIVTEYNTGTGYGGDIFRWDPASTATADNCATFAATGVATGRWIRQLYGKPISVEDCGAYNDGTHAAETLAAFQAANDYVAGTDAPTQQIWAMGPAYNLGSGSTGIVKAASFYCPSWVGAGKGTNGKGTTITLTPSAETAIFTFIGGSGAKCGGYLSGFVLKGNANTVGVELQGQDGMSLDYAILGPMKLGVLFDNKTSGQFTEFNHVTLDSNGSGIGTVAEYRVALGNASFHGSGIVGGVINYCDAATPSKAAIITTFSGSTRPFIYDAPLNAAFFPLSGTCPIVDHVGSGGNGESWFVGDVLIENGGASSVVLGATSQFMLMGNTSYVGNNDNFTFGTAALINSVGTFPSGAWTTTFQPVEYVGAIAGADTAFNYPSNGELVSWQITVEVKTTSGTSYDAFATANIVYSEGDSYTVQGQTNTLVHNGAGYGNIVITTPIDGTGIHLAATTGSYASSGLKYYVTLTQIGQGSGHHMAR